MTAATFRISILLASLVLSCSPAIEAQPKLLESDIDERVARVEKRLGLKIAVHPKDIPECTWPLTFAPVDREQQKLLESYLDILEEELGKYPADFLKRTKLKVVALGRGLQFRKQPRAALPDYVKETLYYDIDYLVTSDASYVRHVIHHEYYHMIEEEWNGSAYYKDPAWAKLNESDFRYGTGGVNARNGDVSVFDHPRSGFVNGYAMSGLEEDKAEVWASMFLAERWKLVGPWAEEDRRLAAKIAFLEKAAKKVSRKMDDAYWKKLRLGR
ncbi:MAG: putative zinc-binding metallopeptidase [Planctomycetota bacterium]